MKLFIKKIISGGQTGADRAGLEAAKEIGIKTGGYCPKNYMTEDGPDRTLKEFGLIQTKSEDYKERTLLNVKYSDGTVIFGMKDTKGNISGIGTILTIKISIDLKKHLIINPGGKEFKEWIVNNNIRTLNVAGNRGKQNKSIYRKVYGFLKKNLLIPANAGGTDTSVYKRFENDIKEIKNDRLSGSGTMLKKLFNAITRYVKNSAEHSSVLHKNIKRNASDLINSDAGRMLLLKGFVEKFFEKFKNANAGKDEKKKYLGYLANYKKQYEDVNKRINANAFKHINFRNKTIVLFSNSSSVVSLFRAMAKKNIFPVILQCESNPEKEGLLQSKALRAMGFKVSVIKEEKIEKYIKKIDFAVIGCDGYNDLLFVNKRGTFDLVFSLNVKGIPVYVLSDSRKYTKGLLRTTGIKNNSLFETIPLKRITKVITEES